VRWRLAGSLVGAVSQLTIGVLLARLLTPADFGVAALAYVVLGLAQPLSDLGLGNAVVQRAELTERHVRTAFTFSTLLGVTVAAIVIAAAPLGATVMRDTNVTAVLRVLSAGFVFQGVSVVAEALLRRHLDFRRHVLIDAASYVVGYGGVAVILAQLGYGVWSLVWGGLVQSLLSSAAQLAVVRHPVRPLLAARELAELLGFGVLAATSSCVNYVALNADYFVVGRLMGAASLGLYSRAYGLMSLPHTHAASVMSRVMLPAFAQVQGEPLRLQRAYLLLTELTAIVAAPSMVTLAVVAPHFVRSLYGPRWNGVIVPLQILCIAGYFRALYHLGGVLAQSVGQVYGELRCEVIYACLVIAAALAGSRYGLPGVAAGVGAAILYMFVACGNLAISVTGTTWGTYLQVQRGALTTAVVAGGAALFARLLLEAGRASSVVITLAVLTVAAIPWSAGILWTLGRPNCEPLRSALPGWGARTLEALDRYRGGKSRR
jgi:PST family polysaccharide transporter